MPLFHLLPECVIGLATVRDDFARDGGNVAEPGQYQTGHGGVFTVHVGSVSSQISPTIIL